MGESNTAPASKSPSTVASSAPLPGCGKPSCPVVPPQANPRKIPATGIAMTTPAAEMRAHLTLCGAVGLEGV
jgi:hypothetical protein